MMVINIRVKRKDLVLMLGFSHFPVCCDLEQLALNP